MNDSDENMDYDELKNWFNEHLQNEADVFQPLIPDESKIIKAYDIYNQLKTILDLCEAKYTIKRRPRDLLCKYGIEIIINTNEFSAIPKNMELFNDTITKLDAIGFLWTKDSIEITAKIADVFDDADDTDNIDSIF